MKNLKNMDTKQLYKALSTNKITNPYFDGIYAKDLLEDIDSKPILIICNTDPSFEPGKHWVVFFFENETCEFFDSLGKSVDFYGPEFVNFVEKFSTQTKFVKKKIQPSNTALCGVYCLFYSYFKCQGKSLKKICKMMTSAKVVCKIVKKMFKICKKTHSSFLLSCVSSC